VLIPQPILPVCYVSARAIGNWEGCGGADADDDGPSWMREMAVLKRSELAKFPITFNPISSQTATKLLSATAMMAR